MQSKLRLKVEELAVESFDTAGSRLDDRGTVKGHDTGFGCPLPSASEPVACLCQTFEQTCDTTCNPYQCDCQPTFFKCTRADC
jgi:predicted SprT family Zn-dependent metalloprotease